jgi:ATPase complex subunit ATP10
MPVVAPLVGKVDDTLIAAMACSSMTFAIGLNHVALRTLNNRSRHFLSAAPLLRLFSTRIKDIQMNPKGLGNKILPGNVVVKKVRDEERHILAERAMGNFWMMKDLRETDGKPIVTNTTLIQESDAQVFPPLGQWITLEAGSQAVYQVPEFFLRNNRADDAKAQCTLATVVFKQYGAQMLDTWTEPFQSAFQGNNRVEIVHLNITEGWFLSKLQRFLTRSARKHTPEERWPTTLLHYASNTDDPDLANFKDTLRIHNTLTAYLYLLDGLGRVRCAASGKASPEEADSLIQFAKDLTPLLIMDSAKLPTNKRKKNRQHR